MAVDQEDRIPVVRQREVARTLLVDVAEFVQDHQRIERAHGGPWLELPDDVLRRWQNALQGLVRFLVPFFQVLEKQLVNGFPPLPGGGSGGQGVTAAEGLFMMGGTLFQKMHLSESEKAKALMILESCCEKSDRIFIRMLLLPAMIDLGFPPDKCLAVCRTCLDRNEEYYRIQAAGLLANYGERHSVAEINLDGLIRDRDVGVRVYAAKVHWLKNRQAHAVVPVLIEVLDRSKHQSYSYAEVQPVALAVLGDIGPEAHEAVGTLDKIIHDPNPAIVKLAAEALVKIRR